MGASDSSTEVGGGAAGLTGGSLDPMEEAGRCRMGTMDRGLGGGGGSGDGGALVVAVGLAWAADGLGAEGLAAAGLLAGAESGAGGDTFEAFVCEGAGAFFFCFRRSRTSSSTELKLEEASTPLACKSCRRVAAGTPILFASS